MHAPTTQRMDQGQSSSDHRPTRHRKQRTRLNRPVMCCLFWTSFVTAAVSVATFKTFTEWLPHAALQSGYKTSCRDLHDSEVVVVGDAVPRHWVEYWAQYDDSFQRLLVLDDNQIVQQQFHIDDLDQTTTVQSLKDGNMVEVGKLPVGSTIASYPAKISAKLDNVTYDVNVKDADKVEVVVGGSSPYVTSKSTTRKMVLTKFTKLRVLGGSREQIGTVWYPAKVSDRKKLKVCVQQAYSSLDADADKKKRQVAFLITKTVGLKPKAAPAPSSRKEKQD